MKSQTHFLSANSNAIRNDTTTHPPRFLSDPKPTGPPARFNLVRAETAYNRYSAVVRSSWGRPTTIALMRDRPTLVRRLRYVLS